MRVVIDSLTKKWDDVVGTENINLDIKDGEFVAFLGPSGCGKTTTLLMVAGVYKPTSGTIMFDDRIVNEVPPKDRRIGMVFQSYALYPHMSVYGNISYPLRLKKLPRSEIKERVQRVAAMMGIDHLLDRKIGQLSGGQQQRVSLGRALVKEPDLLLFDEPLSNLDARLRLTMRGEIRRLHADMGITSIYVTHDQVEAMTMADRIAVMDGGHLQVFDTPEKLYDRPETLFVAGFVGNPPMNLLKVEVSQIDGVIRARNDILDLVVDNERGKAAAAFDGPVIMGIRPEDVTIRHGDDEASARRQTSGIASVVEPLGREDLVLVNDDDDEIRLLVDKNSRVHPGDTLNLAFNTEKVQFFDPTTELSLLWPSD